MVEREMIGGAEKSMLPVGIDHGPIGRAPVDTEVVGRPVKIGEDVVIVFISCSARQLQLRVDLPNGLHPAQCA